MARTIRLNIVEIHKSGKLGTSTIPKTRLYHISAQALQLGREVGTEGS